MTATGSRDGAEVLREAARVMRQRAEAATPGPWVPMRGGVARHLAPALVESVADVYPEGGSRHQRAVAEHIAGMHPVVALAVADWLEREAALATLLDMAGNTEQAEPGDTEHYALAVATAYLDEESP